MKYTDPDGRQIAVPIPPSLPWLLPKISPIPFPIELLPPIMLPHNISPNQDGRYFIEKPWDGDWNNAPNGPDINDPNSNPLGDDWEPDLDANSKDSSRKHIIFNNKKTGEKVRWDEASDKQNGHWHRLNPDKATNKKYPYLDSKGNPSKRNAPQGHIEPNPKTTSIPSQISLIYKENNNEKVS